MLFKKKFEVVEIFESGGRVTHYLRGSKQAVEKDIEKYRSKAKDYQLVGENGMIVWV